MEIFKEFHFEAAHRLDHLPPEHQCARLHGHSYRLRVFIRGPINPATGFIMDFADVKAAAKPVLDQLDHHFLNEVPGMGVSTTENIARFIWNRLKPALPLLSEIELWETATCGVRYRGE
ncbi:MAG: 6-carboxytetrahydropterin synthase QueD [Planctomycetota bacterium]|nr:6-carboxytetrahydropterin synthase QueD [Planctomycetota bacterium]